MNEEQMVKVLRATVTTPSTQTDKFKELGSVGVVLAAIHVHKDVKSLTLHYEAESPEKCRFAVEKNDGHVIASQGYWTEAIVKVGCELLEPYCENEKPQSDWIKEEARLVIQKLTSLQEFLTTDGKSQPDYRQFL